MEFDDSFTWTEDHFIWTEDHFTGIEDSTPLEE